MSSVIQRARAHGVALGFAVSTSAASLLAQNSGPEQRPICVESYEEAQEHRAKGELLQARAELLRCSQSDCPGFVQSDCMQWLDDVNADMPSLLFAARRGAQDLSAVRVSTQGRVLHEELSPNSIELDPGTYDLQFEAEGSMPLTQRVVVRQGEKDRRIEVEFPTLGVEPKADESRGSPTFKAPSRLLPYTLLGIGAAGLATSGTFALWGKAQERSLSADCAPRCSDAEVGQVKLKYVVADIALGASVASLAVAGYLLLTEKPVQQAAWQPPVGVYATLNGGGAFYGASF